jgi:putative Mg2+ transporter-C (MgtC) family protein
MTDVLAFLSGIWRDDALLPLLCSLLAGALIGGEREILGKPAGLRTHMLVCFASTLLMVAAMQQDRWDLQLLPGTQIVTDLSRMPHGILTGIGFLGAGVIFREGASVHGLTTAASLWMTSAIGIVFGAGMVELGLLGLAATLTVLVLLRLVEQVLPTPSGMRISVETSREAKLDRRQFQALLARHGFVMRGLSWRQSVDDGTAHLHAAVFQRGGEESLDQLAEALATLPGVAHFSIVPADGPTDLVGLR